MRNDKKCIPNSVGMFRVSKQSQPGPIFNFANYGGARARKIVKIRPKHFSTVLTGNDRNWTTNCICYYSHKNKDLMSQTRQNKQDKANKQAIGGDLGFGLV